jgi:hypothetical protein
LVREYLDVAVSLKQDPGNDDRRITPGRERQLGKRESSPRYVRRDRPISTLVSGEVTKPGHKKAGDVEQEGRGGRKHLKVARPPQSLVALWAVRRDVHEVTAHAPDDVLVESVQIRI